MDETKRGPGRPKKVEETMETPQITAEMLMKFFAEQSAANQQALLEAVKELKKPDADEQEKRDADKARKRIHRDNGIAMAKKEESDKLNRQRNCSHSRPDGKHNFRAQVNSDGHYRPFCSYCLLTLPAIKATDEQSREGLDMAKWQNVTVEGLRRMAQQANPGYIKPVPSGLVAEA